MGEITKLITDLVTQNALTIAFTTCMTVVTTVILIIDRVNKRDKYMILRKKTINLLILTKEWELTDDIVIKHLKDEIFNLKLDKNRLENENKVWRKQYKALSLFVFCGVILSIIFIWISSKTRFLKSRY